MFDIKNNQISEREREYLWSLKQIGIRIGGIKKKSNVFHLLSLWFRLHI